MYHRPKGEGWNYFFPRNMFESQNSFSFPQVLSKFWDTKQKNKTTGKKIIKLATFPLLCTIFAGFSPWCGHHAKNILRRKWYLKTELSWKFFNVDGQEENRNCVGQSQSSKVHVPLQRSVKLHQVVLREEEREVHLLWSGGRGGNFLRRTSSINPGTPTVCQARS